MITQETFLTAFVDGVEKTVERFIQISQFDKTIQATIKNQDKENSKLYYVSSYGCPNFSVCVLENDDTIYSSGDEVYINLPNGDYTNSNKYILGKVTKISPMVLIKQIDNILVPNGYSIINNFPFNNKNCFQTLIIEFESYIQTEVQNGLGIKEELFPFSISGVLRSNLQSVQKKEIWTTNNLYGNIFDSNFSSVQRIVITGLENYTNINIDWDSSFFQNKNVDVIGLNNIKVGEGQLIIQNLKYYFGYDINELNNNSIYNASILLSELGEKIFYKKDNSIWNLLTDINELNKEDNKYNWELQWYIYNPLQVEYYSYNNPVPQYWDLLENRPENFKKKMVLLKTENLTTYSIGTEQIYSILE